MIVRVTAVILLILASILLPDFNEDWVAAALRPAFQRFEGVTSARVPDPSEREKQRATLIAERERVTSAATWPLMACRSAFIMHNPGTQYRKDELQVRCNWTWFAD
jgi:hypothetical protein